MNKEQQELKNFLNQFKGTIQQKKRYFKERLEQIQDYGYESEEAEKQKLEKILELIQMQTLSKKYRKKKNNRQRKCWTNLFNTRSRKPTETICL